MWVSVLSRGLQVVPTSGTTHYLLTSAKVCFLPLLYCSMVWLVSTPCFIRVTVVLHLIFPQKSSSTKCLHKNLVFVGLVESAFLRTEMLVKVRLPTSGSPQTPRKRDPHHTGRCCYCCNLDKFIKELEETV